ncbi:MAG: ACR3 family arsenite efflux transporter [Promethearchaeota archaeon]|nr:MAG: ACR3 family arsenite efflux transporter [Candidatus Lokiarchaeota archaeon]
MSQEEVLKKLEERKEKLGFFDKYLPVWVVLCIIIGLFLSQLVPGIGNFIDDLQIAGISIPIGICLFLMMYPAMLNVQFSEIKKLGRNPTPIILTLISNWLIAPFVGLLMANLFLVDEQLIVAIILLSSSPCTAMVLVWGWLAKGNQEQNVITTSINTITIIIGYVPLVSFLTGIQNIPIDWVQLLISAGTFIGLPLILGVISRYVLVDFKGREWFNDIYKPAVGKLSIIALLFTLIILFSLNGEVLITNPDLMLIISIPLLVGFAIVVGVNVFITKVVNLDYPEAIITVIIGSSSHFEIAIAVAVGLYGVGSIAALGTTMGLFWEVPVMLSVVYLGRFLGKKGFWKDKRKET